MDAPVKPKRKHSVPNPNKGRGKTYQWLLDHKDYEGEECLIWPFYKNGVYGYGHLQHNGEKLYAHRVMCEIINGPPPSDKHQAAHTCGKGHEGCAHPRHLAWKTVSDNLRDRAIHGSFDAVGRPCSKMTRQQVQAARLLKGQMPQDQIAIALGVKRGTIQYWLRNDHAPKRPPRAS